MEYKEGELVFAYSGPLLYPAKVLKCQHSGGKVEYLIHYNKWNSKVRGQRGGSAIAS
jgi:hypothetical protein